ncbi:placenta growth factor isoform X2 [Silurus meridionalis]|nr:placenta growth factor isoform X2 [Silurus meridionalis]
MSVLASLVQLVAAAVLTLPLIQVISFSSRLNSWNDDDIDLCWCSQLALYYPGLAVRKNMQQPCKSTVLLKCFHSDTTNSTSKVILFQEVWGRSFCRTIETLVEVVQEYPGEVEHMYSPSCVPLVRCAGCCGDENLECHPTQTSNVTMQVCSRTIIVKWTISASGH